VYEASENFGRRSFRATLDSACELDFRQVLRAESKAPRGLRFRWKMGARKPGHLIWTDDCTILLSDELKKRLRSCSGWQSMPVTLSLQNLKSAGSYHLMSVNGRCGSYIPEKTRKMPAGPSRAWEMYQGLCFEAGAEGADLCMPMEPTLHIFMSERAASVIRDLCDNATLTPCEEVVSRENPIEHFGRAKRSSPPNVAQQSAARDRAKRGA